MFFSVTGDISSYFDFSLVAFPALFFGWQSTVVETMSLPMEGDEKEMDLLANQLLTLSQTKPPNNSPRWIIGIVGTLSRPLHPLNSTLQHHPPTFPHTPQTQESHHAVNPISPNAFLPIPIPYPNPMDNPQYVNILAWMDSIILVPI